MRAANHDVLAVPPIEVSDRDRLRGGREGDVGPHEAHRSVLRSGPERYRRRRRGQEQRDRPAEWAHGANYMCNPRGKAGTVHQRLLLSRPRASRPGKPTYVITADVLIELSEENWIAMHARDGAALIFQKRTPGEKTIPRRQGTAKAPRRWANHCAMWPETIRSCASLQAYVVAPQNSAFAGRSRTVRIGIAMPASRPASQGSSGRAP
jgi:hypothetical protein